MANYMIQFKLFKFFSKIFHPHMISFRNFEFRKVIGTGAFGKVYLAKYQGTNKFFAIKRMNKHILKQSRQLDNMYNEAMLLQEVCFSPFIVKLQHIIETPDYIFLVMEYIKGGELFYYIRRYGRLPEQVVRFFSAEIIVALKYLHQNDVIYRDLKPENVLVAETGHIKLVDFGFATRMNQNTYMICGTPEYMAPEKLMGNGDGKETDYWSLGCLIYEMLCGTPPFCGNGTTQVYKRILDDDMVIPKDLSRSAVSLVKSLLQKDHGLRLGSGGIEEIMAHSFFRGINWDTVVLMKLVPPIKPMLYQFEGECDKEEEEPIIRPKCNHTYRRIFRYKHSRSGFC